MKYTTFIFDLDGTLLNTIDDLADAVNYSLKHNGFPTRPTHEVKSFVGNGIQKLISRSLPDGSTEADFEKCLADFKAYYNEHCLDKTEPYEGISDLLTFLKSKGSKIAVVTNKNNTAAQRLIAHNFGSLVDFTLGHTEGIAHKPDPAGVYKAMRELDSCAGECIYIGDSDVDCHTGHNAGMHVIGVTWGFRSLENLQSAGADYIANTAEELLQYIV